jgi:hypothetical protein
MRRGLHLLIILCVLMCGMHLGEPAEAHEGLSHSEYSESVGNDDGAPREPAKFGQGGHNQCPITPDQTGAPAVAQLLPVDAMLFASPVAVLHSLSQAPPLDPPLA